MINSLLSARARVSNLINTDILHIIYLLRKMRRSDRLIITIPILITYRTCSDAISKDATIVPAL